MSLGFYRKNPKLNGIKNINQFNNKILVNDYKFKILNIFQYIN